MPGAAGGGRGAWFQIVATGGHVLDRAGRDIAYLLLQLVDRDFRHVRHALARQTKQIVIGQERQQQVAGADCRSAEFNRCHDPGLLRQLDDFRRQGGGPRIAGLQPIDRASQVARQPRVVDLVVPQQAAAIGVVQFEDLEHPVFDLDVVIAARKAQPSGTFKRAA